MNKTILALMIILISCGSSASVGSNITNTENRRTISSEDTQTAKDIVEELKKDNIYIINDSTVTELANVVHVRGKERVLATILDRVEYARNTIGFTKLTDEQKVKIIHNIVDALLIGDIEQLFKIIISYFDKHDYIKYLYEELATPIKDVNKDFNDIIAFIRMNNNELTDEKIKTYLLAINIQISKNDVELGSFISENIKDDNKKERITKILQYISKIDLYEIIELNKEDKDKKIEEIIQFVKDDLKAITYKDIKAKITVIIDNLKNTLNKIEEFIDLVLFTESN